MKVNSDSISIENQTKSTFFSVDKSKLVHIAHIVAMLCGVALFAAHVALLVLFCINPTSSILLVFLVVSMLASLILLYVAVDYFMNKYSVPIELKSNTENQQINNS
ncbi:hypothetical protein O1W69_02645 [Chlamydia sp. 12-01]|uniref:hypothetical protein n=1 Tax=Chlamydia sp. 12-01 TaxID=3002742 RepID=UPI0035D43430